MKVVGRLYYSSYAIVFWSSRWLDQDKSAFPEIGESMHVNYYLDSIGYEFLESNQETPPGSAVR